MIGDQVVQEIFYELKQPGFTTKVEAIETVLKNYKIQILMDNQKGEYDEHGYTKKAPSFIFIGVKK